MFEALRWHKAQQHAVHTLAQAGKAPIVIGSIAAMALLGMVTGMGLRHKGRGRKPAKVMPAARNGAVRRRKRKTKAPAH